MKTPSSRRNHLTIEKARAHVQFGCNAIVEAARLHRWWNYHERYMWRSMGHPGTQASRPGQGVRAKTDRQIAVERTVREEHGGDWSAFADSLRRAETEGASA